MGAMKKAMKKTAMKKAMKKAAMKKSQVAKGKHAKSVVFRGTKLRTSGGLTKDKLVRNKHGKVVSKAASAATKKRSSELAAWGQAVVAARKALNCKGFVAVGGNTPAGRALYAK